MKKFRSLQAKHKTAITYQVKLMLAAHRDMLWTRWETCASSQAVDPTQWRLVCTDGYYGEAFGVMRGLLAAGYGYFGSDNLNAVEEDRSNVPEHNLKWWFTTLQREYMDEEGFTDKTCSAEKCALLLEKYRILVRK